MKVVSIEENVSLLYWKIYVGRFILNPEIVIFSWFSLLQTNQRLLQTGTAYSSQSSSFTYAETVPRNTVHVQNRILTKIPLHFAKLNRTPAPTALLDTKIHTRFWARTAQFPLSQTSSNR